MPWVLQWGQVPLAHLEEPAPSGLFPVQTGLCRAQYPRNLPGLCVAQPACKPAPGVTKCLAKGQEEPEWGHKEHAGPGVQGEAEPRRFQLHPALVVANLGFRVLHGGAGGGRVLQ